MTFGADIQGAQRKNLIDLCDLLTLIEHHQQVYLGLIFANLMTMSISLKCELYLLNINVLALSL